MIIKNNIGLTGGRGLISSSLRNTLDRPIVIMSRGLLSNSTKLRETHINGSFIELDLLNQFTSSIDTLIHTASAVGPRSDYDKTFIEIDLVGTINLATTFFKKNPFGHFVYISSAGGLYDLEDHNEKTEMSKTDPKTIYGAIKLLVEDALDRVSGDTGRVSILRPCAIYGDSFRENQSIGLIDKLLKTTTCSLEAPVQIFDNVLSARDYLHVNDLAKAIKLIIERDQGPKFEVYNVGTGIETSIIEIIDKINLITDEKVKCNILPVDKNRTSLIVNSDKIRNSVGWKPRISLAEGISRMYIEQKNKGNI